MNGKAKERTEKKNVVNKNLSASLFMTWNQLVFESANIYPLGGLGFPLTSKSRFPALPTPRLKRKKLKY